MAISKSVEKTRLLVRVENTDGSLKNLTFNNIRESASDEELLTAIRTTIWEKPQEHHFELKQDIPATRGMYRIGG